jgi:hypothetical protein
MTTDMTPEYVQAQIDRHQVACTRTIDMRLSDVASASQSLLSVSTQLAATVAKLDERTTLHGQQIDRVEERQAAGNRYAVATVIGICITLLMLIFSIMKEFMIQP